MRSGPRPRDASTKRETHRADRCEQCAAASPQPRCCQSGQSIPSLRRNEELRADVEVVLRAHPSTTGSRLRICAMRVIHAEPSISLVSRRPHRFRPACRTGRVVNVPARRQPWDLMRLQAPALDPRSSVHACPSDWRTKQVSARPIATCAAPDSRSQRTRGHACHPHESRVRGRKCAQNPASMSNSVVSTESKLVVPGSSVYSRSLRPEPLEYRARGSASLGARAYSSASARRQISVAYEPRLVAAAERRERCRRASAQYETASLLTTG